MGGALGWEGRWAGGGAGLGRGYRYGDGQVMTAEACTRASAT